MQVAFTFRHMESSDALKEYAEEKIGKLQKLLRAPIEAEVVASMEKHFHCVDVQVSAGGKRYHGREESEDMYASIDMVLDKIGRQIRDDKDTATQRKRTSGGFAAVSGKKD